MMAAMFKKDNPHTTVICFLFISSILLYCRSLYGGYVWDDRAAIIANKDVQSNVNTSIYELFNHDFWGHDISLATSHKSYRPITVLTFRLNHYLYGYNSFGFHAFNVLIYAFTCVLMYAVAVLWSSSRYTAIVASILFCYHPIHVEAVASLVGRADSLCGLFYFLAIILYTWSIRRGAVSCDSSSNRQLFLLLSSLLVSFVSCFAKEIGATVFGILIIIEIAEQIKHCNVVAAASIVESISDILKHLYRLQDSKHSIVRICTCMVCLAITLYIRLKINGESQLYEWTILENHINLLPTFKERALSYYQTFFWYMYKLIYPRYLCFDYGYACIPTIHEYIDIRNIFPIIATATLVSTCYHAIRKVNVSVLVGLSLLFVPLLPALNVLFPVGTVLAERLLFLPSSGACILISELLSYTSAVYWKDIDRKLAGASMYVSMTTVVITTICVLCSLRIVTRINDWNSELLIYQSALDVCPYSVKALINFSSLTLGQGNLLQSIESATTAIALDKHLESAYVNGGIAYKRHNKYIRSMRWLHSAIHLNDGNDRAHGYLGMTYYDYSVVQSDMERKTVLLRTASSHLDWSMALGFSSPTIVLARGSAALDMSQADDAIRYLTAAIDISIAYKAFIGNDMESQDDILECHGYNQLGNAYVLARRYADAVDAFHKGLTISPTLLSLHTNLGNVYREMGLHDKAKDIFKIGMSMAMSSNSTPPTALINNLGLLEMEMGNYDEAVLLFKDALAANANEGGKRDTADIILGNIKRAMSLMQ